MAQYGQLFAHIGRSLWWRNFIFTVSKLPFAVHAHLHPPLLWRFIFACSHHSLTSHKYFALKSQRSIALLFSLGEHNLTSPEEEK